MKVSLQWDVVMNAIGWDRKIIVLGICITAIFCSEYAFGLSAMKLEMGGKIKIEKDCC